MFELFESKLAIGFIVVFFALFVLGGLTPKDANFENTSENTITVIP